MGRGSSNIQARGGTRKRNKHLSEQDRAALNDFIAGRSNSVPLPRQPVALGYSPAQATASGAGAHGKSGRARTKAERRSAKQSLHHYDD